MIKKILKFLAVFGLIALIAGSFFNSASATTENKEMPTKLQVDAWNTNFGTPENYVEAAYKDYIKHFPAGHVDKIKDSSGKTVGIVFYYYNPSSSNGYSALYYDTNGKKMSPGCNNGWSFYDSYKGEELTSTSEEVTENNSSDESEESDEETVEETTEEVGTTFDDLIATLEEDNTNEKSFTSSKECAKYLISNLPDQYKKVYLVKATFKATGTSGKHLIRYCAGVETSDKGIVYVDSYHGKSGTGIDKIVTVLKAGQRWQAESACTDCPADEAGRYNRGKVLKVTVIE